MKKILFGAAAAAFVVMGGSLVGSDEARAACDLKVNQLANGWECVLQESQSISQGIVRIDSGSGMQCKNAEITTVTTTETAVNPGGNEVSTKNGESTTETTVATSGGAFSCPAGCADAAQGEVCG